MKNLLNSDYFFYNSGQIERALSSNRILPNNYHIQRAQSKIDTWRKKPKIERAYSTSNMYDEFDKRKIPFELLDILKHYDNKYTKENETYQELKEYNNIVIKHWNYKIDLRKEAFK